jgi:hypothetical protein
MTREWKESIGTIWEAPGSFLAGTRTYGGAIGGNWVAPTPCTILVVTLNVFINPHFILFSELCRDVRGEVVGS